MRKILTTLCTAAALAALAAAPAWGSHGEAPHDCLGQEHKRLATELGAGLGAFVAGAAQSIQPFGREFVKDRATECEGL